MDIFLEDMPPLIGQSFGNYKSAPDSFIFILTNKYNIEPTKFPNTDTNKSIWQGFWFGANIWYWT